MAGKVTNQADKADEQLEKYGPLILIGSPHCPACDIAADNRHYALRGIGEDHNVSINSALKARSAFC